MPAPTAPAQPVYPGQFVNWADFYGGNVQAPQQTPPNAFNYATLGPPPTNAPPTGGWTDPRAWANYYQGQYGFTPPAGGNTPAAALGAETYASYSPQSPNLLGWEMTYGNPQTALANNQSWASSLGSPPNNGDYSQANGGWTNPNAWAAYYGGTHGFEAPTGANTPAAALAAAAALSQSSPYDPNILGWELDFGQPGNILAANPDWATSLGTPQTNAQGIGIPAGYNTGVGAWESPLAWAAYYGGLQGFGEPVNNTLQGAQAEGGITNPNDPSLLGWELDYGNPQTVINTITSSQQYKDYQAALAQYQTDLANYNAQQQFAAYNAQVTAAEAARQAAATASRRQRRQQQQQAAAANQLEPVTYTVNGQTQVVYVHPGDTVTFTTPGAVSPTVSAPGGSVVTTTVSGGGPSVSPYGTLNLPSGLGVSSGGQLASVAGVNLIQPTFNPTVQPVTQAPIPVPGNPGQVLSPGTPLETAQTLQAQQAQIQAAINSGATSGGLIPQTYTDLVNFNRSLQIHNAQNFNLAKAQPEFFQYPAPGGEVGNPGIGSPSNTGLFGLMNYGPNAGVLAGNTPVIDLLMALGRGANYFAGVPGTFGYSGGGFSNSVVNPTEAAFLAGNDQVDPFVASVLSGGIGDEIPSFLYTDPNEDAAWLSNLVQYSAPPVQSAAVGPLPDYTRSDLGGMANQSEIDWTNLPSLGDIAGWLAPNFPTIPDYTAPVPSWPALPSISELLPDWLTGRSDVPYMAPGETPIGSGVAVTSYGQFTPPSEPSSAEVSPQFEEEFGLAPIEPTFAQMPYESGIPPPAEVPGIISGLGGPELYQGGYGQPTLEDLPPPALQTPSEALTAKFGASVTLRQILTDAAANAGGMLNGNPLEQVLGQLGAGVDTPIDLTNANLKDQIYNAINAGGMGLVAGTATPLLMAALAKSGATPQAIADAAQDIQQDIAEGPGAFGPRQFTTIPVYGTPAAPTTTTAPADLPAAAWPGSGPGQNWNPEPITTPIGQTGQGARIERGTVSFAGAEGNNYPWISGGIHASSGIPPGTYNIDFSGVGPLGQSGWGGQVDPAIAGITTDASGNKIAGPYLQASGIEIHSLWGAPGSPTAEGTLGCFGITQANWPAFSQALQDYSAKNGPLTLTIADAGNGTYTAVIQPRDTGTGLAPNVQWPSAGGPPTGEIPLPAPRPGTPGATMLFIHGIQSMYPQYGLTPDQAEAAMAQYAASQGMNFQVLNAPDTQAGKTAALQRYFQQNPGAVGQVVGYSQGADAINKMAFPEGVQKTTLGLTSQGGVNAEFPGVSHGGLIDAFIRAAQSAAPPQQAGYNYPSGTFSGAQPIQAGYQYPAGTFSGAPEGIQAGYSYIPGTFGEIDPYNFSSAPYPTGGYGGGAPVDLTRFLGTAPPEFMAGVPAPAPIPYDVGQGYGGGLTELPPTPSVPIQAGYRYIPGAFGEIDPYYFSSAPIPGGSYGGGIVHGSGEGQPEEAQPAPAPIQAGYRYLPGSFGEIDPYNFSSAPTPQGAYGGGSPVDLTQSPPPESIQAGYRYLPGTFGDNPDPYGFARASGAYGGGFQESPYSSGVQYGYPEPSPLGFTPPDYGTLAPQGFVSPDYGPPPNYAAPANLAAANALTDALSQGGPWGGVVRSILSTDPYENPTAGQQAFAEIRERYLDQLLANPDLLTNILGFPAREVSSNFSTKQAEYFFNSALNRGVGQGAGINRAWPGGPEDIMAIFSDNPSALQRPGTGFFPTGVGPGNPSVAAPPNPETNISSAYYPGDVQGGNTSFTNPAQFMRSIEALNLSLYGSELGHFINNNGSDSEKINAAQGHGWVPQSVAGENYVADAIQGYNNLVKAYQAAGGNAQQFYGGGEGAYGYGGGDITGASYQSPAISPNTLSELSQLSQPFFIGGTPDYDYKAAEAAGVKPDERGHMPDTYKLPNHITFSDQSKYHGGKNQGGQWDMMPNQQWMFTPGQTNLQNYSVPQLQRYFEQNEPDSLLKLPNAGILGGLLAQRPI